MEHGLWVPSTSEEYHSGEGHTFVASEVSRHRLDFVCIPQAWQQFEVKSKVCYELDFATAKHDHFLAHVTVRFAHGSSVRSTSTKTRIDVRKCADTSLREKFAQYMRNPPSIPWEAGVGYHAEALTSWLQQGAQACFAPDAQLPRQRYLSDTTWSIIQLRKQLNTMSRRSEQLSKCLLQSWIFQTWRDLVLPVFHTHPLVDTAAHCQMQLRCEKLQWWAIVERRNLHSLARWSSRNDRLNTARQIAESFIHATSTGSSQAIYKALKPLLGQQHRKSSVQYRPIPAVRLSDDTMATTQQEAHQR